MLFLIIPNLSEAVNPVYRRNRLANILRKHRSLKADEKRWMNTSNKLDKKSRDLVRTHQKRYGKWTPERKNTTFGRAAQKTMNREHRKIDNRREFAQDQVIQTGRHAGKAYNLGKSGVSDGGWGGQDKKGKIARPKNPLAKNRTGRQKSWPGRSSHTGNWREDK
jgi:hypothetical protein